jgi:hypothetical protein
MAAIEVLICSHRGISRQRILLLLLGNDSMVVESSIRERLAILCCQRRMSGGTENTIIPHILALGLK